ncbi:MAG TPA: pseudouridine synthase [Polyangia bacterium]|jgi:23S rRNA pseudouridine2605 synthase|nr:pseudouridine synthase [Polyangia bacterium]
MTEGRIRLHVFLARAGVAARRKCEQLMTEGRVGVNGRTVRDLGTTIDPVHDKVTLDRRRVTLEAPFYILMHKPRGYVTTVHDPEGRPTVMSLLGEEHPRLFPVGRLDLSTDGVLLLTNDGDLANHLMHPRYGVAKTYHAKLQGELSPGALAQLAEGVRLEDGSKTQPAVVRVLESEGKHPWVEITIKEGKNRQVHRMAEAVGNSVVKLSRVRYGPLTVEELRPGTWRPLTARELGALRALAQGGDGEKAKPQGKDMGEGRFKGRVTSEGRPKGKATSEGRPKGKATSEGRFKGKATSEGRFKGKATSEGRFTGKATSEGRFTGKVMSEGRPTGKATTEGRPKGKVTGEGRPKGKAMGEGRPTGKAMGEGRPKGKARAKAKAEVKGHREAPRDQRALPPRAKRPGRGS